MDTKEQIAKRRPLFALMIATGLVIPAFAVQFGLAGAQVGNFADPAFKRVWERTDLPVAQNKVSRTWLWGPSPGRTLQEPFREGPGGQHLVQYFDKARMEINDPAASPTGPYYVTNGLLVVEMISGRIQNGINEFENLGPSDERIAGDDGSDAPTYAALQSVASVGLPNAEHRVPALAVGSTIPALYIGRNGYVESVSTPLVRGDTIKAAAYSRETGHNIPNVFLDYMTSQGPVYEGGTYKNAPLINWTSALGYPVAEPYWTRIRVQGKDRLVLFQAFQRRVLTYSPDNPDGWKVEMGNVGLQYYNWRYETAVYCAKVPVRGFGKVWAEHGNVQRGVGCPLAYPPFDKEQAMPTSFQPFERGTMLWVSMTAPYVPSQQNHTIYVFFNDGTYQQFEDTWQSGEPANGGLTPPSGLYEPQKGFGKVWREGTGAKVRERLGWATAPEKGGAGAYQRFERGEMFWTGAVSKIYVLYNNSANSPYPYPVPTQTSGVSPFRYDVYDDTFSP